MKRIVVALLGCALAGPGLAQEGARDWDLLNDPGRKLVVAYIGFDNGLTLATRCADGGFETLVTGLPPAGRATRRPLRIAFGEEELVNSQWSVATQDTVAVADLPAPFARRMRAGGRLRILVPGGASDGRNLMYDLQLPASAAAVDHTLTACGRPVTDPRDAELDTLPDEGVPGNLAWAVRPTPTFPNTRYARGFAVITCMTNPDGRLRDCTIESEYPRDGGFGDATLAAARRGRVENLAEPGGPVPAGQALYKVNFIVDGYQTREDEQARRENRAREREQRAAARRASGE